MTCYQCCGGFGSARQCRALQPVENRTVLQDAAPLLVAFDSFKKRLEVAVAKAVVALALDDLEKDRANVGLGKDLQQLQVGIVGVGVNQDLVLAHALHVLAVVGNALVDNVKIRVRGIKELDAVVAQGFNGLVDIVGVQRDMLYAFALVFVQKFVDLAFGVFGLVDGDGDFGIGSHHGLRAKSGVLALDVEILALVKAEQVAVEVGPLAHVAVVDVVGQMVDEVHAGALGMTLHAVFKVEVLVQVGFTAGQVQHRTTNALNARYIHGQGVGAIGEVLGAFAGDGFVGRLRVVDAQRKAGAARAVGCGKFTCE